MTLYGTLKKIDRAQRRAARQHEREAKKRHRELKALEKELAKQEEKARAQHRLESFHSHLELIRSLHKESSDLWDWKQIEQRPQPELVPTRETAARHQLTVFDPGFLDKIFGRADKKRAELEASLAHAIEADRLAHTERVAEWAWFNKVAIGINAGDLGAYAAAVTQLEPWDEVVELGAQVQCDTEEPWYLEIRVGVAGDDIVPEREPTVTKTGKGGEKAFAKSKRFDVYQDYVCSLVIRVAREAFAHLPVHMVFVHAERMGVDSSTGRDQMQTFVSAAFDRPKFEKLVFHRLDPSDAVEGFTHHMKFKKTGGFVPVERLPIFNSLGG